jgi:hypothetical protein
MRFLLRIAFWFGLVLLLLPTSRSSDSNNEQAKAVNPLEAASAATATFSDMRQFCARQPEACAVGAQVATAAGQRAQVGAKMLYEFLSEKIVAADSDSVAKGSRDTLTHSDLVPNWRGPGKAKDAPNQRTPSKG